MDLPWMIGILFLQFRFFCPFQVSHVGTQCAHSTQKVTQQAVYKEVYQKKKTVNKLKTRHIISLVHVNICLHLIHLRDECRHFTYTEMDVFDNLSLEYLPFHMCCAFDSWFVTRRLPSVWECQYVYHTHELCEQISSILWDTVTDN